MKPHGWLKGLGAAVIGAMANAIPLVIVDPVGFNPFEIEGLAKLARVTVTSALLSAALYLKQSPLPSDENP